MSNISVILKFEDLFDEEPESIDFYLSGVSKEYLIYYAIKNLSLSTIINETKDIFWAFFNLDDVEEDYYRALTDRIQNINNSYSAEKPELTILNVRSSLFFFEYIQKRNDTLLPTLKENQIRINLLKAYLLINSIHGFPISKDYNELFSVISNALTYSLYSDIDLIKLRLAEIIKACLFFEYCEKHYPKHLEEFIKYYSINTWKEYTQNIHQLGKFVFKKTKDNPVTPIYIPETDREYEKKVQFLDSFCQQNAYNEDEDFTHIKTHPVYKDEIRKEYSIIFEQFFIEKMYKGLYFKFKDINDNNLKGTPDHIKDIRSTLGENFSEKILLNRILKDSLGDKYKHLGANELGDNDIDYYIRDRKYILLFENKDNLVSKRILSSGDIDSFITKLEQLFICNEKGEDKAIRQLIKNIEKIQYGDYTKDPGINPRNCIIYPIIVIDNSLFSLNGINTLINQWFISEIKTRKTTINTKQVKPLTIIDIDSLVIYQGLYSKKEFGLRHLIDDYWHRIITIIQKENTGNATIEDIMEKYLSFKFYLDNIFKDQNIFTKEITQYNKYFSNCQDHT